MQSVEDRPTFVETDYQNHSVIFVYCYTIILLMWSISSSVFFQMFLVMVHALYSHHLKKKNMSSGTKIHGLCHGP